MLTKIEINDLSVEIQRKNIKNLHLTVCPPLGQVRVSAPNRMQLDIIHNFVVSKIKWIHRQQQKLQNYATEIQKEYVDSEIHYLWGQQYCLKVVESPLRPTIEIKNNEMHLHIKRNASTALKQATVDEWYRIQVKRIAPALIAKWEKTIGVTVKQFSIRKMTSRWGSCTPHQNSIRLNSELAKKSMECLEYIIVHELVHLLEPSHNHRFKQLMTHFMPNWHRVREALK
jgi:hypothetical protein